MGIHSNIDALGGTPVTPSLPNIGTDILKAQLSVMRGMTNIFQTFTGLPGFDTSGPLNDIITSLESYSDEENLSPSIGLNTPFEAINGLMNSMNSYHLFLEGQKTRKFTFEIALTQIQTAKQFFPPLFFPLQARALQQAENFARTNLAFTFTFNRPDWNLDIAHEDISELDFCNITKFEAAPENNNGRSILLVAPMSGHFPTLLRKTIESLHNDGYTVFITDWKKPFDVEKDKGDFTIEKYTQELLNCFGEVENNLEGGDFEVLAVCQPGPETMTAVAYAEKHGLAKPRSIGLMASPIDVDKNPTQVNEVGQTLSPEIKKLMKFTIPEGYPGAGREVYISPMQISLFIMSKPEEHMENFKKLAFKREPFTVEEEKMLAFYTEYFAGCDLFFEFYDETTQQVFKENRWGNNNVTFAGEKIDFSKTKTSVITFEGREDDICGIEQTKGANELMINSIISEYHLIAANDDDVDEHGNTKRVGHYGVFAGKYFRATVLPALQNFYQKIDDIKKAA